MHRIGYTPIIDGLEMMDLPSSIEKVKAEIRKYGNKKKCKHKINEVINGCIKIDYIDDNESVYLWNEYRTSDELPEAAKDYLS